MPVSRDCGNCHEPIPIEDKLAWDSDIPIYCPCCGEGAPRREGGTREKKVVTAFITIEGVRKEAVTMDVSISGMKIFYLGSPLPVESVVLVDVDSLSIYGRWAVVAWSHKAASTYSHSGLKLR